MNYSPYAPPQQASSPYTQYVFRPLGWRTTVSVISIGAASVLSIVTTFLKPSTDPAHPDLAAAMVLLLLGLVVLAASLAALVVFFMWIHTAAENVRALGSELLEYTPGWCIAWWFIPVANLWKPYSLMSELWRASDLGARRVSTTEWQRLPSPRLLTNWWGVHLLGVVVGLVNAGVTVEALLAKRPVSALNPTQIVAQFLALVSSVLLILVLRAVDKKQLETANAGNVPLG